MIDDMLSGVPNVDNIKRVYMTTFAYPDGDSCRILVGVTPEKQAVATCDASGMVHDGKTMSPMVIGPTHDIAPMLAMLRSSVMVGAEGNRSVRPTDSIASTMWKLFDQAVDAVGGVFIATDGSNNYRWVRRTSIGMSGDNDERCGLSALCLLKYPSGSTDAAGEVVKTHWSFFWTCSMAADGENIQPISLSQVFGCDFPEFRDALETMSGHIRKLGGNRANAAFSRLLAEGLEQVLDGMDQGQAEKIKTTANVLFAIDKPNNN